MAQVKSKNFLTKARNQIAKKVRILRHARQWSQAELAAQLGLSQNRLSEIERGAGSFSAEQFLLVLKLFNVSVSEFEESPAEPTLELQNALARFGASHLHEASHVLPSDQLAELGRVIREALVDGSPRFVTALAPILIRHARTLNLRNVQAELTRLGYEHRLPWVVDNTLEAAKQLQARSTPKLVLNTASLQLFLNFFSVHLPTADPSETPDVLDPTIRTLKTVAQVKRNGSAISQRWGIVTAITPEEFVEPLKAAHVSD